MVMIMTMDAPVLRWGEGKRVDPDVAREQILDAALRCYQQNTFQKTRMEHIAREAKVSRTTIYRYFESRDDVLIGVVLRSLRELMDILRERVGAAPTFAEFVVETIAITIDYMPHLPLFEIVMKEGAAVIGRVHVSNNEVFGIAAMHFRTRFEHAAAAGELRSGIAFEQFMEWIIHMGSTFVLVPSARCEEKGIRQMLWRYMIPSIVAKKFIPPDRRA